MIKLIFLLSLILKLSNNSNTLFLVRNPSFYVINNSKVYKYWSLLTTNKSFNYISAFVVFNID
jgi:hypothetical protein